MGIFAEVEKVMRSKRFKYNVLDIATSKGLIDKRYDVSTDADLDNLLKSVYANMPNGTISIIAVNDINGDTIFDGGQTHITIYKYTDSWGTIKTIRYGLTNLTSVELVRNIYNGEWKDWSWINPPMNVGVEYKTSEHYKGKPVYRKLIEYTFTDSVGDISTYTDITIPTNIEDDCDIIKLRIYKDVWSPQTLSIELDYVKK